MWYCVMSLRRQWESPTFVTRLQRCAVACLSRWPVLLGSPSSLTLLTGSKRYRLRNSFQVCWCCHMCSTSEINRMWANAQRDGRPAEYRWRPLFNAAKFGWRPILECRAVTLPIRETCWNFQGCPKLPHRSQPLIGRSSPYCGNMWRRYCCLTSFFPIVDT